MDITVIDLGNYNVKGINSEGKQVNFKSNVSRDYEAYPDGFNYINIDGEYTFFEKGNFSKEYIKTKKDYVAQLLYAISKLNEDKDTIETNLTLLLPISEMEHNKKYVDDLKGKEFSFAVKTSKKSNKKIKINDVFVVPEGYASYFILEDSIKRSNALILDIGGRTTNVVAMDNGKPQVLNTYKIGVLDFYLKLKNINSDKEYKIEDIEKAISKGDIKISKKHLASFTNDIINEVSINVNLNHYNYVIFTGGGSLIIEDVIKESLPKQCVVAKEPLYTNIKGSLIAAKEIWK
ncbi:ParM/StbA family protein [Clostridium tertium]|uniref:ParM/StbA family protein n=1 Tax=Clostridium tertium TaxID=1559 RepID=UPI00232DDAE9|nr:ParM/StbA family protein [Clostridium tertium]MDB1943719.1 ParM/StbA family protein [Clostridium tertium]MDB1951115.1 ParM/StbA family protein [Clostridium tertium]